MAAEEAAIAGPRPFWSGTLTFGLVSVPVDLYPAVRARRVALRMLGANGQPLQRRYVCSADGARLSNEELVRGYEREDGTFTVVSDDELAALSPQKSRDIDLRRFVDRDEIPRELLERPYVLAPAGESTKAYHLLAQTMERSRRAGIATFVMRGKEYLAAIFAEGGVLVAEVMRFANELRSPADIGLPSVPRVSASDVKAIEARLAKLEKDDIDRDALQDSDAVALLELAERKHAAGKDVIEVEEATASGDDEDSADILDIMSVLKQRLGAARPAVRATTGGSAERLEKQPKKALYERAKRLKIPARSGMSKEELVAAIQKATH